MAEISSQRCVDSANLDLLAAMKTREKELLGIVENAARAFEAKLSSEIKKKDDIHAAIVKEKDLLIDNLKSANAEKDEKILEQLEALDANEKERQELLRGQKRELLLRENELRNRITQIVQDKEKLRFAAESMQNTLNSQRVGTTLLHQRAAAAEEQWKSEARDRLVAAEAASRNELLSSFDEFHIALHWGQTRSIELYRVLDDLRNAQVEGLVSTVERTLVAHPSSLSPPPNGSVVQLPHQKIELMLQNYINSAEKKESVAAQVAAREASERLELSSFLQCREAEYNNLFAQSSASFHSLQSKLKSLEDAQSLLRARVIERMPQRAAARANADVLQSLVEEHEVQMVSLTERCKSLEAEVEYYRGVSQVALAAEWKEKAELAFSENKELRTAAATAAAKASGLSVALRDTEMAKQELSSEVQRLSAQIYERTEDADARDKKFEDRLASIKEKTTAVENELQKTMRERDAAFQAATLLQEELSLLRHANQRLRQKWIDHGLVEEGGSVTTAVAPNTNTAADTAQLEKRVQQLRRERDELRRKLDAAIAEISSIEERRYSTMEKYMKLLSAMDAAPRQRQELQSRHHEIDDMERALAAKAEALARRENDLDKKEAQLNSRISKLQTRGLKKIAASGGTISGASSAQVTPRVMGDESLEMVSSGSGTAGRAVPAGPRLAPIRGSSPRQQTATTTAASGPVHPQRFVYPPPSVRGDDTS